MKLTNIDSSYDKIVVSADTTTDRYRKQDTKIIRDSFTVNTNFSEGERTCNVSQKGECEFPAVI